MARAGIALGLLAAAACTTPVRDDYDTRYRQLAARNEDFGRAVDLLEASPYSMEDRGRVVELLERSIARSPMAKADESIIRATLAFVHLPGVYAKTPEGCRTVKKHSSAALSLDPASTRALEMDIAADLCLADFSGNYDALINRLEGLRRNGKYYPGLYIALSLGYEKRSERTGRYADLVRAREAWDSVKARKERIAGEGAWETKAEDLDEKLRERKRTN